MKPSKRIFIIPMIVILFVSLACTLTVPGSGSTPKNVETSVAQTLNALTPGVGSPVVAPATLMPVTPPPPAPAKVAFINSARNLFVWTDGTAAPVQLTSSGDAVDCKVSADGSMIAFTRSADFTAYQLDVINSDGSNQRTLVTPAALNSLDHPAESIGLMPYKFAWIPNTHQLAMSLQILFEGPGLQIGNTLYKVNADDGSLQPLVVPGENFDFSFSPDGNWLAISRSTGIDLYTGAGTLSHADILTYPFVNTASEYAWVADPVWSQDSSYFMAVIPPQDPWNVTPEPSTIWHVTTAGTVSSIYNGVISYFPSGIATFNPALNKMAFPVQIGAPTDNVWGLHVVNVDGSGDAAIDNGYFSLLPRWSANGTNFVYAKLISSQKQAYLVDGAAAPVSLADVPNMIDVRWLDDTRFVISGETATGYSLLLEQVGGSAGVIYNDPAHNSQRIFTFDVNR